MSSEQRIIDEQKKQAQIKAANAAMDIAQGLQEGRAPPTEKVVQVLESTEVALDRQKLSPEVDEKGKTIIRDTENLIGATKELLQKKNPDDKLQTIVTEATLAGQAATSIPSDQILGDAEQRRLQELRFRMMDTARMARELLQLVVSSAEFRSLLLTLIRMSNFLFLNVKEEAQKAPSVQQALQQGTEAAKQLLTEPERLPERDRYEMYQNLNEIVRKVNASDQWRQGVRNMFLMLDRLEYGTKEVTEKAAQAAVHVQLDRHAEKAIKETKELVEEFLPGEKTLDPLLENLRQLLYTIRADNELRQYFGSLKEYLNEAMDAPAKLDDEAFRTRGEALLDNGRTIITKEEYTVQAKRFLNEWREVIEGFKQDDELNMFNSALQKLARDLTYTDSAGRTHLDTHALGQIRSLIVPIVMEQLKYIPIKHMEGSNKEYDWTADSIIVSGYDIIPEHVLVQSFAEGDVVVRGQAPSVVNGYLMMYIDRIKTKMSNVKFWFKRKTFPRMEDSGNAEIDVAGGISLHIRINMATDTLTNRTTFTEGFVYCRADDVNVKVSDTKHDWIYNTFPGLFANPIKANMEKSIAQSVAAVISRIKLELNNLMAKATAENVVKAVQSAVGRSEIPA